MYFLLHVLSVCISFVQTCLSVLGIPSMDVVRVLAAILLLGNIQFIDGQGMEVDIKGGNGEKCSRNTFALSPTSLKLMMAN